MRLADALAITPSDIVGFVGGGGKTSAMFRLAEELVADGLRVLTTTTTRIACEELALAPHHLTIEALADLPGALSRHRHIFLYASLEGEQKIRGPTLEWVDSHLAGSDGFDVLLVEADGSRRLPFKAPYPHEPALPTCVTMVVASVGLNVLGNPLDAGHVYGAELIHEHTDHPLGGPVTPELVAAVLAHPEMGLRGVPSGARFVPLLNQADAHDLAAAREITQLTLQAEQRVACVLIGAVQTSEPVREVHCRVGAVVLAAGLSTRMGKPKLLLPWGGVPMIEHVCRQVLAGGLDRVVVVTGAEAESIESAVSELPVETVFNPDYAHGEMLSSLQVGLRALGENIDACLIILGDQPEIEHQLIASLLRAYFEGRGQIIVPSYRERHGHPVLIDRAFWPELLALPPSSAPRDVVRAHRGAIYHLVVDTPSVLRDVDTPEDYRRALEELAR